MTQTTSRTTFQYFNSTGPDQVVFSRPINAMMVTASGTVNISFDGYGYMNIVAGTHEFTHLPPVKNLYVSGTGNVTGWAFAL